MIDDKLKFVGHGLRTLILPVFTKTKHHTGLIAALCFQSHCISLPCGRYVSTRRKFGMRFYSRYVSLISLVLIISYLCLSSNPSAITSATAKGQEGPSGSLTVFDAKGNPSGQCPLKRTEVKAEISGFLSRVVVKQEFENPFKDKIEAVYTFPLPRAAAVDDMTMHVGNRTVRGRILRREQAQAVYDAARASGQVASLLDQERPNIFTQSVANIMPGEKVTVEISYVETLKYEDGAYEFVFPTVVGPRYNPSQVIDASRVTPSVAAPGTRAGHDISIEVSLDAGVGLDDIKAATHEVDIERQGAGRARIALKKRDEIPNRDFILRYEVAGQKVQDALLTHRSGKGGFFTFILQPPERVTAEDVMPKELVFVLDTSGSMSGFPLDKARETMKLALDSLYPQDTFNLITFAGDTSVLFPQPVPATKENLEKAQKFLDTREGGGGTEMMKAIKTALDPSDAQSHVRIVCFMTDGYVGNDMEIVGEIKSHPNARVFSFGIGSSVNRFLLDKMAEEGRGEVEYVGLNDDGSAAAKRFHERVRNPLLTDIKIDWNGLPVADVYPKRIPDLFSAKPVIVTGRFTGTGKGVIKLNGMMSGRQYSREIAIELPEADTSHDVLATLWARTRIEDLMGQDWSGIQHGTTKPEVKETITQLGLEYRLMTQFTSFVAVEEMIVTDGGQPRRVEVPVDLPSGMRGPANTFILDGIDNNSSAQFGKNGGANVTAMSVEVTAEAPMINSTQSQNISVYTAEGLRGGRSGVNTSTKPSKPSKREVLASKLDPVLSALVARLEKKGSKPASEEAKFVIDGKALVQIFLTDRDEKTTAALQKLGVEIVVDSTASNTIIARVPVEKLKSLALLKYVNYLAPQVLLN